MDKKNEWIKKERTVIAEVRGLDIEFVEYYYVDSNGEERFDRELEIENDSHLYDIYKTKMNLLTSAQIKKIRKAYDLTQKEYAKVIGVGEVTINRFENGAIQTSATDSIIRLSQNPNNMWFLFLLNGSDLDQELHLKLANKIQELQLYKKHCLANICTIDKSLSFKGTDVLNLSKNIIMQYNNQADSFATIYGTSTEYITNLKLQKLLYYVQGIALAVFNTCAFKEKISAWAFGPVVNEAYLKYKDYHAKGIPSQDNISKLSPGLQKIVDEVIISYGALTANKLILLTHEEEPWKSTQKDCEISTQLIKEYFDKIYNI